LRAFSHDRLHLIVAADHQLVIGFDHRMQDQIVDHLEARRLQISCEAGFLARLDEQDHVIQLDISQRLGFPLAERVWAHVHGHRVIHAQEEALDLPF
jgi:hypothetical protein